jgi:hypothetical protein
MSGKMNWGKARRRFTDVEEKYKPGTVLNTGRQVYAGPRDSLDARARKAELEWKKSFPKRKRPHI